MVLFGSLLDQFVGGFARVNVLSTFEFDAVRFMNSSTEIFLIDGLYGLGHLLRLQSWRFKIENLCRSWWWCCVDFEFGNALLEFGCFADSMVGPDSAVLLLRFLLKIRSVKILDTILCSGALLWLFPPAWDAVKLTLQVGFICPFVVIDPTDLGATFAVAQALCLTIFNLSPTQKTCLFTDGNKLK